METLKYIYPRKFKFQKMYHYKTKVFHKLRLTDLNFLTRESYTERLIIYIYHKMYKNININLVVHVMTQNCTAKTNGNSDSITI